MNTMGAWGSKTYKKLLVLELKMEIVKGISIVDLGLYLSDLDTLVFGDFHIGYEEMLNKKGVLVPRFHTKDIILRLEGIFKKVKKVKRIIVNGDLKHEFGIISEQEWRDSLKLLDYLSQHCEELVLVRGNHDKILGPIAKKRDLKIVEHLVLDDVLICHGDKIVKVKVKTIIIGHEHPAVSIREGARVEKFKCFLQGNFERKKLIVMPSFNLLGEGTDVLKERVLSPYLKRKLSNFEVYVVSDKIYDFGKLKGLKPKSL
jgi:putative SbcD/Mre11-related phosphoesterase